MPSEGAKSDSTLFEQIGYTRREVDEARARLRELERTRDELRGRRDELARQIEFVQGETDALRKQLAERLGTWCQWDDADQRAASVELVRRVDEVRSSTTYRLTAGLLLVVNKVRRFVTFAWLRGAK